MSKECIVNGPTLPIPETSLGKLVYDFLQQNKENSKAALIDAASLKQLSYKEILGLSCTLAKALQTNNYRIGCTFVIYSENTINFAIPLFSALFMGAIISPINPTYTEHELVHCLSITKSPLIFCSISVYEKIVQVKSKLDFIKEIIVIDSEKHVEGAKTIQEYISAQLVQDELSFDFEIAKIENVSKQIAFILYSSGTTGYPKGVMLSHKNYLASYTNHMINSADSLCFSEYVLSILPLFHSFGLGLFLIQFLRNQTHVILKRFEPKLFLESICKYQVKILLLVPPLMIFLAKNEMVNSYDLSHLVEIVNGAAPLAKDIVHQLKKRINSTVKIYQSYGLTETTFNTFKIPKDCTKSNKAGSVGLIVPNCQVKIKDVESGKTLGVGERGEVCIKGPLIMLGYYGNEEATKEAITSDGWFQTGDVAYYDEENYFYVVDRIKELIKYNGYQIAPAELEGLLLQNKEIVDAVVVGIERDVVGEVPVAFVQKVPNSNLTENDVKKFVEENVSYHKYLRGGVVFIEKVSRSLSGKILRKEVRKLLK